MAVTSACTRPPLSMRAAVRSGVRLSVVVGCLTVLGGCDSKPHRSPAPDTPDAAQDGGVAPQEDAAVDEGGPTLEERWAEADREAMVTRPEGWAAGSHCKLAPADGARVFAVSKVARLVIKMTAAEYKAMNHDLTMLAGGEPSGD